MNIQAAHSVAFYRAAERVMHPEFSTCKMKYKNYTQSAKGFSNYGSPCTEYITQK